MEPYAKIALGGGCHWCTEAVFQSLKGVQRVDQGFVRSIGKQPTWSEAVVITYHSAQISLQNLIAVHLHTHNSTADHSMRNKYRSAIYFYEAQDEEKAHILLKKLQVDFKKPLVTQVLPFVDFKPSEAHFHDYYYSDPERPFCTTYISPKLKLLLERFSDLVKREHTDKTP